MPKTRTSLVAFALVFATTTVAQQPSPFIESIWFPSGPVDLRDIGIGPDGTIIVINNASAPKTVLSFDSCGEYLSSWPTGFVAFERMTVDTDNGVVHLISPSDDSISTFTIDGELVAQWGTSGSANGELNNPRDIALDDLGRILVCDTDNHRVQVFSPGGSFQFSFGLPGTTQGAFTYPHAIAVDHFGHIYVADYPAFSDTIPSRVQKFDSNGSFEKQWFGADFGAGIFNGIAAIAIDEVNNVYVADFGPNGPGRIQKFDNDGNYITQGPTWDNNFSGWFTGLSLASDGSIFAVTNSSSSIYKILQPFVLSCPRGDLDGDCDIDVADFIAMTINMTGPLQPAVVVDAGCLASDAASAGSYFSDGNDLHGYATQQGYGADDWTITWVVESKPAGSGTVAVFDPNQLESAFVVTSPALSGDYVFRLTVTNLSTNTQATDVTKLKLAP